MDLWLPRPPGAWERHLSNLIFSGLTWAFIPAAPCLCAGWSGAANLSWLTYTVWKGSLGPPVSSASSLLPSSLSPGNRGLLWSPHMSRAMVNWCALLINWIPALSSQPLGAVKDCAFGRALLVFRADRAVGGGPCWAVSWPGVEETLSRGPGRRNGEQGFCLRIRPHYPEPLPLEPTPRGLFCAVSLGITALPHHCLMAWIT